MGEWGVAEVRVRYHLVEAAVGVGKWGLHGRLLKVGLGVDSSKTRLGLGKRGSG